jgi:hypothetical protein
VDALTARVLAVESLSAEGGFFPDVSDVPVVPEVLEVPKVPEVPEVPGDLVCCLLCAGLPEADDVCVFCRVSNPGFCKGVALTLCLCLKVVTPGRQAFWWRISCGGRNRRWQLSHVDSMASFAVAYAASFNR